MEMDTMMIEMEDGSSAECEVLGILPANGRDYIILLPDNIEGVENTEGEYYIFRYEIDDNGEVGLGDIEDEQEFESVAKLFQDILDQMDENPEDDITI